MVDILEYITKEGKAPFDGWLRKLNTVERGRIRARLNRVRLGNFGDCISLGEGVYELRFFFGPGYRVYFGREDATVAVLLLGGCKSTQKKDIKKAKFYWMNYKGR